MMLQRKEWTVLLITEYEKVAKGSYQIIVNMQSYQTKIVKSWKDGFIIRHEWLSTMMMIICTTPFIWQ